MEVGDICNAQKKKSQSVIENYATHISAIRNKCEVNFTNSQKNLTKIKMYGQS